MKRRITIIAVFLVAILVGIWSPWSVQISTTGGYLSVGVGRAYADEPPVPPEMIETGVDKYQIDYFGDILTLGKDNPTFVPEITMYRFNGESFLTLYEPTVNGEPLSQKNASSSISDNTVLWASKDLAFAFYPLELDLGIEGVDVNNYGFEYAITMANSKAGTDALLDSITFPYDSGNLTFYYQTPYTSLYTPGEYLLERQILSVTDTEVVDFSGETILARDEWVSGSYAAYTDKRNGVYKTGKAFHLYRPQLFDNKGDTAWADLIIDSVGKTITIDFSGIASWLNKAKYPVLIDPTWGYTSIGGSTETWGAYTVVGAFTSPADIEDATSMVMKTYCRVHSSGTANYKATIWESGSNGAFVSPAGGATGVTTTASWYESTFGSIPGVSNSTTYNIGPIFDGGATVRTYHDSGGTNYYSNTPSYASPSGTLDGNGPLDRALSVYIEYEVSGGTPSVTVSPSSKAFGVIAEESTNWSNGSEPSWPLTDGDAFFTLTNDGSISIDMTANCTNPTGGVGATAVDGTPGSNQIRVSLFMEGDGSSDNTTIVSGSNRSLYSGLAASANVDMEIRLEMGTVTDGTEKTFTITIIASAS